MVCAGSANVTRLEQNIGVIACSIPALQPLIKAFNQRSTKWQAPRREPATLPSSRHGRRRQPASSALAGVLSTALRTTPVRTARSISSRSTREVRASRRRRMCNYSTTRLAARARPTTNRLKWYNGWSFRLFLTMGEGCDANFGSR